MACIHLEDRITMVKSIRKKYKGREIAAPESQTCGGSNAPNYEN